MKFGITRPPGKAEGFIFSVHGFRQFVNTGTNFLPLYFETHMLMCRLLRLRIASNKFMQQLQNFHFDFIYLFLRKKNIYNNLEATKI